MFQSFSDACPVCGSTRNQNDNFCREDVDRKIILCRNSFGDRSGFKYVKTVNDLWGLFRQIGATNATSKPLTKRAASIADKIGVAAYAENLRLFASHCDLSSQHHRNLASRGLKNHNGIFSYDRDYIPESIKRNLPCAPFQGMYVPIYNHDGFLVGYQVRLADKTLGGKYRWFSKNGAAKVNGEYPVNVVFGSQYPKTLILCEGILKSRIASEKLGCSFIGASGGMHHTSMKSVKAAIKAIQPKQIFFAPDAGAKENLAVNKNTAKQCIRFGAKILDYGQMENSDYADIDEIDISLVADIQQIFY